MSQNISAPAISRILNNAGFTKAKGSGWSSGYVVTGYGVEVEITYMETDSAKRAEVLGKIAETINTRDKYFAMTKVDEAAKQDAVRVVIADTTDPQQNAERRAEALEKLAEQSPYAPNLADVKAALRKYDRDGYAAGRHSGWVAERDETDSRLVRVTYCETPFTTYETDRDTQVLASLMAYVRVLEQAGFSTKLIEDEWAVLVGTEGEFPNEAKAVKEALDVLRDEVENDLAISTRRVGTYSIFIIRQLSFKDRSIRMEVFYDFESGEYRSNGRMGADGVSFRTKSVREAAQLALQQLPDAR